MNTKPPIINCHTHIFKSECIPPYIGKTFMPWPLYKIFSTRFILKLCHFWFRNEKWSPHFWRHKFWYKRLQNALSAYRAWVKRYLPVRLIISVLNNWLILHAALYLFKNPIYKLISLWEPLRRAVDNVQLWLTERELLQLEVSTEIKIAVVVFVILFLREGRKIVIGLFKNLTKIGGLWPDKKTIEFLNRYVNIGRFAIYQNSSGIFSRLRRQYDAGSGFVILPMDMEYMDAGKVLKGGQYRDQMDELASIKSRWSDEAFPFVFIDPRRIEEDPDFLIYDIDPVQGKVTLKDCFVREFIEGHKFNGFKIYPALGYYPFDERLLILWKYAADHGLPILTHAIRGTIYYRGAKKIEWNHHPAILQYKGWNNTETEPLLLPELKHVDFINNFTHPLNYLCLVDERMLRKLVAKSNPQVKSLFGFTDENTPMRHHLGHLKICFGHFGGEDEWLRYLEADRHDYAAQLTTHPDRGIDFLRDSKGNYTEMKLEEIWKKVDWYSILCSLMLQYENLYADISYIVHDPAIFPLLRATLQHQKLRQRVLFGTDFYVVRNHKSEKHMLTDLQSGLSAADFDQIARMNPRTFLRSVNFT